MVVICLDGIPCWVLELAARIWRAAPFFAIWTGQAISLFGSQLVQFALSWWLTKTTGSPTVLAVASLVGLLPQVILGPIIGTLVDRWNRRITMMIADSVIAAATLGLAVVLEFMTVQGILVIDIGTALMAVLPLFFIPALVHLEDGRGEEMPAPVELPVLINNSVAGSIDGD